MEVHSGKKKQKTNSGSTFQIEADPILQKTQKLKNLQGFWRSVLALLE